MSKAKISVLYLDDEENNLTSFKATFRRDFEVHTTTRPSEAVEILNANEIHLIIADQKMPDISGVEFLELVKTEFPDPVRMLLTGYADIQAVIDAINRGQIYRYITKPWDEQDLRMILENAYEIFHTRKELKTRNQELKRAYSNLERFVYSASHDLRAPIVSIQGIMDVIKLEPDPLKKSSYISMLEQSVVKLDHFTQNLINYYQNLHNELSPSELDIEDFLTGIKRSFDRFDQNSAMKVEFSVIANRKFKTDENRLKTAIQNIVSNSLAAANPENPNSFVKIQAEIKERELLLHIQDNGKGMNAKKLSYLKDTLEGNIPYESGRGLGTFIVREVLHKLHGKARIESKENEGCNLYLVIPEL
jgi:light-regulated signal transduction histidine kinase (bacteriophytochrome)